MTPKQKARVQAEAKHNGIPFSEMVNRMVNAWFDNKETPEKLEAEAEAHLQRAVELREKAALIRHGPDDDTVEDKARVQILSFIDTLVRSDRKYRYRHMVDDVDVRDRAQRFLIRISNDQLLLGRLQTLFAETWTAYFDVIQEGKAPPDWWRLDRTQTIINQATGYEK